MAFPISGSDNPRCLRVDTYDDLIRVVSMAAVDTVVKIGINRWGQPLEVELQPMNYIND